MGHRLFNTDIALKKSTKGQTSIVNFYREVDEVEHFEGHFNGAQDWQESIPSWMALGTRGLKFEDAEDSKICRNMIKSRCQSNKNGPNFYVMASFHLVYNDYEL